MTTQNASNQKFTNNSDGFDLAGGTTARKVTVSGGDVEIVGAGTAIITFPSTSSVLATQALSETLTNKTLTDPKIVTTINAQTGTTYTLALTDASKIVTLANASAITVTIPTNAVTAFPIGTQIDLIQILAGKVTISGAGVTINSKGGNLSIGAQWVDVTLIKTATDTWIVLGDLIA